MKELLILCIVLTLAAAVIYISFAGDGPLL